MSADTSILFSLDAEDSRHDPRVYRAAANSAVTRVKERPGFQSIRKQGGLTGTALLFVHDRVTIDCSSTPDKAVADLVLLGL